MQSISIDELLARGFKEDSQGLKELERTYSLPGTIGIVSFILSFALMVLGKISAEIGLTFVGFSWVYLVVVQVFKFKSKPRSPLTGKVMLKYKNRSPGHNVMFEVIYVCPDSKTFFRRVYLESDGPLE